MSHDENKIAESLKECRYSIGSSYREICGEGGVRLFTHDEMWSL